jgi:ketosteroid isomerase-like protein
MAFDIQRLFRLWTEPATGPAAEDAFRELYTDPVEVNGTKLSVRDLVDRATRLQGTLADLQSEVLDVVDTDDQVAVAFVMRGRQIGPMATAAGTLAPTGRLIEMRVIDVLTFTGGRISRIHMVADELGMLAAVGAVSLIAPTA